MQVLPVTDPEVEEILQSRHGAGTVSEPVTVIYNFIKGFRNNNSFVQTKHDSMRGMLTSIDDPDRVSHSLRHVGLHPRPQFVMDLLSLRGSEIQTAEREREIERVRQQRERETQRRDERK